MVDLSIKKATDLAKASLEAANEIKPNRILKISIYGSNDPKSMIEDRQGVLYSQYNNIGDLIDTHYTIKRIYGEANDRVGITTLLRQAANIDALEKRLSIFLKAIDPELVKNIYGNDTSVSDANIEAITDRIQLSKNRLQHKDQIGGIEEGFEVSITQSELVDTIRDRLRSFRRQKMAISDQIASLNANTKVTIPMQ